MNETERIVQQFQTTPPSCIAAFRVTPAKLPIEWDQSCRSIWRLSCDCGGERGRVLGYPLSEYNKDLPDGADCLIGPISFECVSCGKVTTVIDTDRHGYSAEVAKREGGIGSAIYRGSGLPAAWGCPQCDSRVFSLTVAFIFWDAVFDLAADGLGWPLQEFFTVFLSFAQCSECRQLSEPTNFGKL